MNFCTQACPSVDCVTSVTTKVHQINSVMGLMLKKLEAKKVFGPLIPQFEKMFTEWDELAEDCAIATDPEIRDLLSRVADAI